MGVDASAIARVVGITSEFRDLRAGNVQYLPQRIAVVAQGATASAGYSMAKWTATSANDAGARYGYGSPIHLILRELLPVSGDGIGTIPVDVFPLEDHASGVAADGSVTPSGTATKTATYYARLGGVLSEPFSVASGSVVAATVIAAMITAINAVPHMPVIASDGTTELTLTSKWEGESALDITIEILDGNLEKLTSGSADGNGVIMTIVAMANGATNPTIDDAIALIGNVWETMLINGLNPDDTAALGTLQTWGEGRWGTLVHKPCVAFTGWTGYGTPTVAAAITIPDARKTDYINCQLVAPGSPNLPCVVAARQVARIAKIAQNNPPTDYGMQIASGLVPGDDGDQWTYTERDQALKGGSSTVEVNDSVVYLGDVVTMYHPDGEVPPAYRYVVDIVKIANIAYNLGLIFASTEWAAAPLIPDSQATVNPNARRPMDAKAAVNGLIDNLALQAIISDPDTAKAATVCVIDSQNPKRLNVTMKVALSGNTNIKDIILQWGFYYYPMALAA
jgi:phage tail sheath gpL-like